VAGKPAGAHGGLRAALVLKLGVPNPELLTEMAAPAPSRFTWSSALKDSSPICWLPPLSLCCRTRKASTSAAPARLLKSWVRTRRPF